MPSLEEITDNLSDISTLPDVVAKLTQLIADPDTTASDINEALSRDPGLSAKILRIVNSSFYGFSRRIATITSAVVILGFSQVRNLALSAFVFDNFASVGNRYGFDLRAFWKHSLGVAFFASHLARRVDARLEEDAFICGLLHDLGKCVMAQKAPSDLAKVMELVAGENILFLAAEKRALSYDHAQLGAAVVERWNLPQVLVEVIREHHDPLTSMNNVLLTSIVNAADIFARSLFMGSGGDGCIPRLLPGVWERMGINWEVMEQVARKAAAEFRESDMFFSTR